MDLSVVRYIKQIGALAIFCLCGSFVWLPAWSIDSLSQGIEQYNQKQYSLAAKTLQKAVDEDPYNARSHYYLANTWMYLKNTKQASKEYKACFDLEPLSESGQLSRTALLQLGLDEERAPASANSHLVPDPPVSVQQAIRKIDGAARERELIYQKQGTETAKAPLAKAEQQIQEVRCQQKEEETALKRAYARAIGHEDQADGEIKTPGENSESGRQLQYDLKDVAKKADAKVKLIREQALRESVRIQTEAIKKSSDIESYATGALGLMSEDARLGRVRLRATGTDFYTRRYSYEKEPTPQPLQANWEKMGAGPQKAVKTIPLVENDSSRGVVSKVSGKLLKP